MLEQDALAALARSQDIILKRAQGHVQKVLRRSAEEALAQSHEEVELLVEGLWFRFVYSHMEENLFLMLHCPQCGEDRPETRVNICHLYQLGGVLATYNHASSVVRQKCPCGGVLVVARQAW